MPRRPGHWIRAAALGALAACSDSDLRSVCVQSADCAPGERCLAGRCETAPPGPSLDRAPPPSATCPLLCGGGCCEEGMVCLFGRCAPACATGVWCGPRGAEACCGAHQVCGHDGTCRAAREGPRCEDGTWDPALGACVHPVETRECERPQLGPLVPERMWSVTPEDAHRQVVVTPLVVDVNGDGASDVVAPFFSLKEGHAAGAVVRALSGADGRQLWSWSSGSRSMTGVTQLAAAVLDPFQGVAVLGTNLGAQLVALSGKDGSKLWESVDDEGNAAMCDVGWGAPLVVNLDADSWPEIVCGFTVFDRHGVRVREGPVGSGPIGSITVAADLDLDGNPDLTDGTTAVRHDGTLLWRLDEVGGLPAVADLVDANGAPQPDGTPEVVVVRGGLLELRSAATGENLVRPILLPTWDGAACYPRYVAPAGVGGAPAVGDLNGDGVPEVVVASGECLAAFGLRLIEGFIEWWMAWSLHSVDQTSGVTGAVLFDLDADGLLDVAHADETMLRLVEGETGTVTYGEPHCSGTVYETPAIADVDGDGSANVVVARNVAGATSVGCDPSVEPGIFVLREKRSRWANARGIWNQHAYAATSVCDGHDAVCEPLGPLWGGHAAIPMDTPRAWEFREPGAERPYNAARANTHGPWQPNAGADAAITHLVADARDCPEEIELRVRIVNRGGAPLRPGTEVRAMSGSPSGPVWAAATTRRPLAPGAAEVIRLVGPAPEGPSPFTFYALVDAGDVTAECDEANNGFGPIEVACR